MTIFTSKVAEKKDEGEIPSPVVVSEYKLLVEDEKVKADGLIANANSSNGSTPLAVAVVPRRRHSVFRMCAMFVCIIVLLVLVLGGIMVYNNMVLNRPVMRCGVHYVEGRHPNDEVDEIEDMDMMTALAHEGGEFEQEVTIDDVEHERIEVPRIGDTRQATVLHDFNKNITAIVDREQRYCFIMPLNRTLVMPPRDFWDLLVKLKTGYYLPDVEVVRENYRALTPPIQDLTPYGFSVWKECHLYDSYKLVREDEPMAISKRSAVWCEFSGDKWCLGDAGTKRMLCIGIKGCM